MTVTLIDQVGAEPLLKARIRGTGIGTANGLDPTKFSDPDITARGEARASVALERLDTVWFNTGTLCNIECTGCYIESGPKNDRLAYVTRSDVETVLDEIRDLGLPTREIGFTGGEPFMNRDMIAILDLCLSRGFEVLVLTNAMQPLQRPRVRDGLERLRAAHGSRLTLRVSLDHYTQTLHDAERGPGSWRSALAGLDWLSERGFRLNIAGRTCWGEDDATSRAGFGALCAERGYAIDAANPAELVLFPEMDAGRDVPEITVDCFDILGVVPASIMCASSRMVVKRRGRDDLTVLPCTLLAYDPQFEMGSSLEESLTADGGAFREGSVKLNHPHCAAFCVLGGGACSVDG